MLFLALALIHLARWPSLRTSLQLVGIGALHQGVYACASFWAVDNGLNPALMTLLGTLQPPLTAVIAARLLDERASARVAIGLALGVLGTAIAVWPEGGPAPAGFLVVAVALASVLAITTGTLLQKGSAGSVEFVPSSFLQYAGGALCALAASAALGQTRVEPGLELAALLAYAVVVLSLLGTSLLVWMVREGSATRASSLLFLTPPLSALLVWLLFDEGLSARRLVGFAIAVAGVFLARRVSRRVA